MRRLLYAYPNVAAEPAIYCPSVRIIPLGPGPYRTMFVNPCKDINRRAHARMQCLRLTEDETNDYSDGYNGQVSLIHSCPPRYNVHPPIMAPILTIVHELASGRSHQI